MQFHKPFDKFVRYMELEKLSPRTIKNYKSMVIDFCIKFRTAQDLQHISIEDIERYLVELKPVKRKQSIAALDKFFTVNGMPNKFARIPYPKIAHSLPIIISKEEMLARILAIKDVRYRAIFALIYETGIRLSECATLKLKDFNKDRMEITIRGGKGGKDRPVSYGIGLRNILKPYFVTRRESEYLFHGANPANHICTSTIEKKCKRLMRMKVHGIRHNYSVHYLESGGDIYTLSVLLGHNDIRTTIKHYAQFTSKMHSLVQNPLDYYRKAS